MHKIVLILALAGLTTAGCLEVAPQPAVPPTTMSSWGPMGGFSMSSGATCAGHATLNGGIASVSDPCFTSSENIVMCTDTTAANGVKCAPSNGYLAISGFADDTISYARVR
jgi:hypothetical protein